MSNFHRAFLKMAWLHLCRNTNELTGAENCYLSLNRELRWLWNSVYVNGSGSITSVGEERAYLSAVVFL